MPVFKKAKKRGSAPSALPKLPKNGYKGVRKIGRKFQGYTPRKSHVTHPFLSAAAAAAALANKEYTTGRPKKLKLAASINSPKQHKAVTTGARLYFSLPPRLPRLISLPPVRSRCGAHLGHGVAHRPALVRAGAPEAAHAAGLCDGWLWPRAAIGRAGRPAALDRAGQYSTAYGRAARHGAALSLICV
jgi:hypothetical protein